MGIADYIHVGVPAINGAHVCRVILRKCRIAVSWSGGLAWSPPHFR